MSSGLARSRGRRRKGRTRSHVVELSLGAAAFAVGAFAIAGPLSHPDAAPANTAAAPAPHASPAGELTVASVDTGKKTDGARKKKAPAKKASGPSKYTDKKADAYFRSRWNDKTAKKVKDIRTTGRYLRIYTSLPENADNSKAAITLCKRGLEYLAERGEVNPVVFVQSRFGENGNPVLANVLGPDDDDCRVTYPKPN
ncbi:hypothetical protein F5972_05735 [Microbispora cellulosiformans]|uniref:Uncharacterized protein n=1 Tax=Microbispora cellulosiformans TaxID=2614688 RepID=A0A5J5K9W8_9ACTN|nr:hypothetical protein [Microbispora cellulosiformans]KAA9380623.1 hypothetical protein F5972_05735 [Microbispora cellulosiformans]